MAQSYTELEREARLLSPEERALLVDALLDSLREVRPAEVEAAWAVEIERRVAAYERGDAKFIPAEDVFAKARLITCL
jgi:putative addiction module component (TIGR02574 family)